MKKLADVARIVENFESFGTQLNSFVEEINQQVRRRVEVHTKHRINEPSSYDTDYDRSDWMAIATSLSIPIKALHAKRSRIYLSFVIELTSKRIAGEQLQTELAKTPVLHVAISWVQATFNRGDDYWIVQIPPAAEPDEYFQLEPSGMALWVWPEEGFATERPYNWQKDSMLFSYPLEVFSGPAEVEKDLVDPLIKILNGDPPAEALKGVPLLRYQRSDDKSPYSLLVKM